MSGGGGLDPNLFGAAGGYAVRIMDLSGGNGSEPVETIKGFRTLEHANGFARRYVRDSLERCRVAGHVGPTRSSARGSPSARMPRWWAAPKAPGAAPRS